MRLLPLIALLLLAGVLAQAEGEGLVCIDPIEATEGNYEFNTRASPKSVFTVQIDDLSPQTITASSCGVFKNLDVSARHLVKIKMDGEPYCSFWFSFKERGSNHLRLWYNCFYGTWQLWPPGRKHECAYLKEQQKRNRTEPEPVSVEN